MFLKISQNSQGKDLTRSLFQTSAELFSYNFAKCLRTSFFACNAKSFAISCFILFLPPSAVLGRFLSVFNPLLPKMRVTSIGPVSLDTLANVFVLV